MRAAFAEEMQFGQIKMSYYVTFCSLNLKNKWYNAPNT